MVPLFSLSTPKGKPTHMASESFSQASKQALSTSEVSRIGKNILSLYRPVPSAARVKGESPNMSVLHTSSIHFFPLSWNSGQALAIILPLKWLLSLPAILNHWAQRWGLCFQFSTSPPPGPCPLSPLPSWFQILYFQSNSDLPLMLHYWPEFTPFLDGFSTWFSFTVFYCTFDIISGDFNKPIWSISYLNFSSVTPFLSILPEPLFPMATGSPLSLPIIII